MEYFKEFIIPDLVTDVQSVYWEHIFPKGVWNRNQTLKNFPIARNAPENSALAMILDKYPFLHNHLLTFVLAPKFVTHIHMDGLSNDKTTRQYSFNIPIEGCNEDCVTEFFETDHSKFFADVPGTTRWYRLGEPKEKVAEYQLINNPILTNTQVPHRVNNSLNLNKRVSVSWTIKPELSWEQVADYIAKNY